MSDPCRKWRRQLSRHADGVLSPVKWGALQDHLAQCGECRAAHKADAALRDVLSVHDGLPDKDRARRFDDRVVRLVHSSLPARRPLWQRIFSLFALPVSVSAFNAGNSGTLRFVSQVAGGALAVMLLTAVCLLPTLRPLNGHGAHSQGAIRGTNEPPVPLEALMETNAPRAALLWRASIPARSTHSAGFRFEATPHFRPPMKRLPESETKPTLTPHHGEPQRGSLPSSHVLG